MFNLFRKAKGAYDKIGSNIKDTINTTKEERSKPDQTLYSKPKETGGKYTVKPGDTLSSISQQLGLPSYQSLTGYRSGDPNKIYPGETLSYGACEDFSSSPAQETGQASVDDSFEKNYEDATAESVTSDFPSITAEIRDEYEEMMNMREQSRKDLENARSDLYNKEYATAGLDKVKESISMLDENILDLRSQRDEAVLTAKKNPNISAGVLAGEVGKITDYFNSQINNEINRRNSVAEDYNRGLDEIETRVSNQLSDLYTQYDHWNQAVGDMESRMARYEDILRDELYQQAERDRWQQEFDQSASQFARQLEKSLIDPDPSPSKLVTIEEKNTFGEKTGVVNWYDPYTGELVKTTGK